MTQDEAIAQIRTACNSISVELMRLNPPINVIDDKATKDELFKTLFEITQRVEVIKKSMRKLEARATGTDAPPPVL